MTTTRLDLADDLVALLRELNQPLEKAARELIVLELYRRASLSSGKAAELLGMPRVAFIHYASRLGLPFFSMSDDEWGDERRRSDAL